MKTYRNIIAAAMLAAFMLALALPAQAQQYTVTTLQAGGTNNVAKAATNTYASASWVMPGLAKYEDVALYISAVSQSATNLTTITFVFDKSVDGTLYGTTERLAIPLTLNGTTVASITTNLSLGPIGYLRLNSIRATNADDATTNLTIKFAVKPKRNG